jgi:nucleotide-binding universal stress UspA family protein
MERVLLGSVADKIVRGAEVPVLVAPARRPAAE